MSLFATVDPGLNGTGWAIWSQVKSSGQHPLASGVIHDKREGGSDWFPSGVHIVDRLIAQLENEDFFEQPDGRSEVIIEYPGYWEGSPVSQTSARSGSLIKLACLVGMMADRCSVYRCRVTFITPQQWKGNLPKGIIHKEILKRLGTKYREHEADAIGMGLYIKGAF